jgi:hypothetical protein
MNESATILLVSLFFTVLLVCVTKMHMSCSAIRELRERVGSPGSKRPLPPELEALLEEQCERFGDDKWTSARGAADVRDELIREHTRSWHWVAGPYFSAVALVLTFFFIALAVQRINFTGESDALKASIQSAAENIGMKFWVSAAGLACAVLHTYFRSSCIGELGASARQIERALEIRVMTAADAHVAIVLNSLGAQQKSTQQVVDGTAKLFAALQSQLEKHDAALKLLVRIEQYADQVALQQGEAFGEMTEHLGVLREQFTGERIDQALGMLREVLGSELEAKLKPLQLELQSQRNEELLNALSQRLHSAITGGASDVTREFNVSLQHIAKTLPEMLTRMEEATTAYRKETRESLEELRRGVTDEMASLDDARRAMELSLRKSTGEVYAFTERVINASEAAATKTIESVTSVTDKTLEAQSKFLEQASRDRQQEIASHMTSAQAVAAVIAGHIDQLTQVAASSQGIVELARNQRLEIETLVKGLADAGKHVDSRQEALSESAEAIRDAIEDLAKRIDGQIEQFVTGAQRTDDLMKEASRVDGTLRSIVGQVKDALTEDLERAQKQVMAEHQLIDKLLRTVDSSLVAGLSATIGELTRTIDTLGQVVDRHKRATAAQGGGAS